MTSELFNTESEIAVLSTLIRNPDKLYDTNVLKIEHFTGTQNQIIFRTIVEILSESLVPDKTMLLERLNKNGTLDMVGKQYIEMISNKDYNDGNFREYETNLVESYVGKGLLGFMGYIKAAIEQKVNVYQVASELSKNISDLISARSAHKTRSTKDSGKSYWEKILNRIERPNEIFLTTGFSNIDSLSGGIEPGQLWLLAGRPGMGKSSFIINAILNQCKKGLNPILFSKEMNWASIWDRMVSVHSGIELHSIRTGALNEQQQTKLKRTVQKIEKYEILIDENFSGNIDYLISTIRKYHHSKNLDIVFIDYVQLLADRTTDSTHEIGRISKSLKLLAEELEIGIVLASQLNREVEYREDKRPILSDLRQSGNLEEDADFVAFLYRDVIYNDQTPDQTKMEYIIRKNRNGPIGTLTMSFDKNTTRVEGRNYG